MAEHVPASLCKGIVRIKNAIPQHVVNSGRKHDPKTAGLDNIEDDSWRNKQKVSHDCWVHSNFGFVILRVVAHSLSVNYSYKFWTKMIYVIA